LSQKLLIIIVQISLFVKDEVTTSRFPPKPQDYWTFLIHDHEKYYFLRSWS